MSILAISDRIFYINWKIKPFMIVYHQMTRLKQSIISVVKINDNEQQGKEYS